MLAAKNNSARETGNNSVMAVVSRQDTIASFITVKEGGMKKKICTDDICLVESLGDYVVLHSGAKRYVVHSTMHAMLSSLGSKDFIRTHRSYIVRLKSISECENDMMLIEGKI